MNHRRVVWIPNARYFFILYSFLVVLLGYTYLAYIFQKSTLYFFQFYHCLVTNKQNWNKSTFYFFIGGCSEVYINFSAFYINNCKHFSPVCQITNSLNCQKIVCWGLGSQILGLVDHILQFKYIQKIKIFSRSSKLLNFICIKLSLWYNLFKICFV